MENVLEISVTSSIIWTKYGAELKLCCTVLTRIKVIKWSIDAELGSTFEAKYFFMVNILCLNHISSSEGIGLLVLIILQFWRYHYF